MFQAWEQEAACELPDAATAEDSKYFFSWHVYDVGQ